MIEEVTGNCVNSDYETCGLEEYGLTRSNCIVYIHHMGGSRGGGGAVFLAHYVGFLTLDPHLGPPFFACRPKIFT